MGHITQTNRELSLVPSAQVLETIRRRFNLVPIVGSATDGPARRYS